MYYVMYLSLEYKVSFSDTQYTNYIFTLIDEHKY